MEGPSSLRGKSNITLKRMSGLESSSKSLCIANRLDLENASNAPDTTCGSLYCKISATSMARLQATVEYSPFALQGSIEERRLTSSVVVRGANDCVCFRQQPPDQ